MKIRDTIPRDARVQRKLLDTEYRVIESILRNQINKPCTEHLLAHKTTNQKIRPDLESYGHHSGSSRVKLKVRRSHYQPMTIIEKNTSTTTKNPSTNPTKALTETYSL